MSPRAYFQNFRLGKSNCFPATRGPGGVLAYNIDGVLALDLGGEIWTLVHSDKIQTYPLLSRFKEYCKGVKAENVGIYVFSLG